MGVHFNNYLTKKAARGLVAEGVKEITMTPTAKKQTPDGTLKLLEEGGITVAVNEVRGRPRKLSVRDAKRILAIRDSDVSVYKIAALTGIPKSTVHDYLKRYQGEEVAHEEVEQVQMEEARRVFETILRKDLSDEINVLARRGLETTSVAELEYLAMEVNEMLREPLNEHL